MYAISNSQRAEITKLLAALTNISVTDNRTANLRRRARIAVKKLGKAKKTNNGNK